MTELKRVLFFPSEISHSFTYSLPETSLVLMLPPFIEKTLQEYFASGENLIFGREVVYIFYPPNVTSAELYDLVENIYDQLDNYECVIIFGPYKLLNEAKNVINDSYFHIPENGDKDYVIDYIPSESDGIFPLIRPLEVKERICLQ